MSDAISKACSELQSLQRLRAALIRSRLMASNNRLAFVARLLGYTPALEEKQRKELFDKASKLVAQVVAKPSTAHEASVFILAAEPGIASFEVAQRATEKEMRPLAESLPVAAWCLKPEQRGFGLLSLAVVVGECGDLRGYANPAKLWRRLGCAPWEYGGKTQMGATWKSKGGLNAEQWTAFGYSPRRRSIAYVIGENLVKQNSIRTAGGGDGSAVADAGSAAPGTKPSTTRGESAGDTERMIAARGGTKKSTRRGDVNAATEPDVAAPGGKKTARRGAEAIATAVPTALADRDTTGGSEVAGDTVPAPACPGPYRLRYDTAKAALAALHPGDDAYKPLRCHRHGMLLATKLLLKNLWKQWCPAVDVGEWSERTALVGEGV